MPTKTAPKRIPPVIDQRTIDGLAERYLTTPRTIRNWLAKGYNPFDPEELDADLRTQRTPGEWMDRGGYRGERRPVPPVPHRYSKDRKTLVELHGTWGDFHFGCLILSGRVPKDDNDLPPPYGHAPTLTAEEWEALDNMDNDEAQAAADKWWQAWDAGADKRNKERFAAFKAGCLAAQKKRQANGEDE